MGIKHATLTAVVDDPAYDIGSDEWNADHTADAITIATGTITTSNPAWSATQTWNAGAVTFTALKLNVTDTASAAGSKLIDLQAGGTSYFYVWANGLAFADRWVVKGSTEALQYTGLYLGNSSAVKWSSSVYYDGGADTGLYRNAAGVVEVNNGSAGTYRDLYVRTVMTNPVTVANLPAGVKGMRAFVTDATGTMAANIGAIVAGTGANNVPVHYDGTNWRIG